MTTRRDFLRTVGSCSAHLALMSACAPLASRRRWAAPVQPVVATAAFAHLDAVGPGSWALISTPLTGDRTTVSNGGIIAGTNGVIAIEGFYKPEGAQWLADHARQLTGRWPTHVVLTHYHSDHAGGLAGYRANSAHPVLRSTTKTRELALSGGPVAPAKDEALTRAFADVVVLPSDAASVIDLGDRKIRLVPLAGHTASDMALVDDDARITWTGDLMWNAMFPNYVDATPSLLAASVRKLSREHGATFIPGHGAVADRAALDRYLALLDDVEHAARTAHKAGKSAAEAGAAYTVPPTLGDWVMFSKAYFERAMGRWYLELGAH